MTETTLATRWEQYNEAGRISFTQGDHARAEESFRSAIAAAEQLGPDSLQLASSLSNLGQLKYQQRDHAQAVELFSRSLAIREGALGSDHVSVAQSINNLAAVHVARNDLDAAEPLLRRALAITEQQKGTLHPDLAVNLNNLAKVYFKRADHASAEPLLRRLLAIKQVAGRQHPEVATVLASLATLKQALGEHAAGATLWREALEIRELPGSPEGPRAAILDNLADCSLALGDRGDALALRVRALEIRERAMGGDHLSVIAARARIAELRDVPAVASPVTPPDDVSPPTAEQPVASYRSAEPESMTIAKSAAEDLWWDPNASPTSAPVVESERPSAPIRRAPSEHVAPAIDNDSRLRLVAASSGAAAAIARPLMGGGAATAIAPTAISSTYAPPAPMPARMALESSLVPMPMPAPPPVAPRIERVSARPVVVQRDDEHLAPPAETRESRTPNVSYSMEQPARRGKLFAIVGAAIAAAAVLFFVFGGKSAPATPREVPVAALIASERVAEATASPAPAAVATREPAPAARRPQASAPLPLPDEPPPTVTTAKRVVAAPQSIGPISMDGLTNDIEAKTRARVDEVTKVTVKAPTFKTTPR